MDVYTEGFPINFAGMANEGAVVTKGKARFTLLTSRLLRLEYSPSGDFEDRPSQAFWYRKQEVPSNEFRRRDGWLEIETEHLVLRYHEEGDGFIANGLSILIKESGVRWHFGERDPLNLKGTARTLDDIDGAIDLGEGLISRSGWSLWDDSEQLLFTKEGWLTPRAGEEGYRDLYFFGYGQDYYGCLRDFCKIAGPAPMMPRWALGNWWSRYWAYSAAELLALMDDFKQREIPLSVCIVDMDWHIVDTGNQCSGWTGYTWNRELFPNPAAFIRALHKRGLKTALNLHPAEGIHSHEAQYGRLAAALGIDPEFEEPIPFAIGDPQFTKAYFEELHHPYEAEGIDFWWLDWQQGKMSGLPGLDPLWWLNHLHFYDLARNGDKRPFIFSRWGGLGNHRYPIGFSGDTHVTWESLAFQPYFTATAANVNYGWWSHDIGGHMYGEEEGELYARWVQFGVFSPILRLHSTNNPYHERRPWGYDAEIERVSSNALRLRHQFIPYLQSMAWINHHESVPLVRPMYYEHPEDEQAYHCRNQYLFGSELIVAPFTTPADPDTRLSRQVVWLPAGDWFDFFSGERMFGDGWQVIYGSLDDIPVFAQAGAIIPLAVDSESGEVSKNALDEIHVFPGQSGSFTLVDEEGAEAFVVSTVSQEWTEESWRIEIEATSSTGSGVQYDVVLRGVESGVTAQIECGQGVLEVECVYDVKSKSARTGHLDVPEGSKVTLSLKRGGLLLAAADDALGRQCDKMLSIMRMNSKIKLKLHEELPRIIADPSRLGAYQLALSESQLLAFAEKITGSGVERVLTYEGAGEEIILWNNKMDDLIRWTFAAVQKNGLAHRENGELPKFAVLSIKVNGVSYQSGSQPFLGRQSIAAWFESLVERIPREPIQDIEATVQFDITGDNGCQKHLEMDRGELRLNEGKHGQPSVSVQASSEAWLALINGDKGAEEMFLGGNLQIGGSFEILAGIVDVFTFTSPGHFPGVTWRLDVNYLDAYVHKLGTN